MQIPEAVAAAARSDPMRAGRRLDKAIVHKVADAMARSLLTRIADALTNPSSRSAAGGKLA
jgi:hypothetical protein